MIKSVLERLSAEAYSAILDEVELDPSKPYGLRWRHKRSGRRKSIGRTFWIDDISYQSAHIVLILNDQWPISDDLVATRIDSSLGWNNASNLQWITRGEMRHNAAESKRINFIRSVLGDGGPDLGPSLRLGQLCKKGHLWNGHPLSLMRKDGNGWRCNECERERHRNRDPQKSKEWYQANIEEQRCKARERMKIRNANLTEEQKQARREHAKNYWRTNGRPSRAKCQDGARVMMLPGQATAEANLRRAIRNAGRCPSVARLVMEEQRRYWREHPEARREHDKQWSRESWWLQYQINPGMRLYNREKSRRRKALIRERTSIQIKPEQLRERFAQFGDRCAYCGKHGDLHMEHVVPISQGGPHSLGNIIPACRDCNFSKRDHDVIEWYVKQPFYSELRWRKICKVLGWNRSCVGQLAML